MSTDKPIIGTDCKGAPYAGVERILGVYPQRQDGLFMQRIRILGGRIGWRQWRRVAELARHYFPIHITTRQDIELHNVPGSDIYAVQKDLKEVGLSIQGACGDTVRNITVCSGCPFSSNAGGVLAVAEFLHKTLMSKAFDLPRKFKISFSGCLSACAKPWVNDLGFVLQRNGHFTVIGAGSLGPKPGMGTELYRDLAARDVAPMCIAALEFFEQTGDRQNRHRARLRHVREKLGDEQFETEFSEVFERVKKSQAWPDIALTALNRNIRLLWRLQLPNGNITADEAVQLADAAESHGAELRINLEHGLELYGAQTFPLPDNLAALENLPVIITCPGSSSCARAITDTWSVAEAIRQRIAHIRRPDLRICISGCPNSCAHSAVADIGLIGLRRNRDGRSHECFRLLTGGHNGRDNRQSLADDVFFAEDVPANIERLFSPSK
jgi:sulfite reductase (ferredoxin)